MRFFLTDVTVKDEDVNGCKYCRPRIWGVDEHGQKQFFDVKNFQPYVIYRLSHVGKAKTMQVFQRRFKVLFTHQYKLRNFECTADGKRKKYDFIKLLMPSVKDYNSFVKKNSMLLAKLSDELRRLDPTVRILGDEHDGTKDFVDGRVCNQLQGNNLCKHSHEFLHRSGMKSCHWHNLKNVGPWVDFSDWGAVCDESEQSLPTFPITSWDIETVNTLCFTLQAKTIKALCEKSLDVVQKEKKCPVVIVLQSGVDCFLRIPCKQACNAMLPKNSVFDVISVGNSQDRDVYITREADLHIQFFPKEKNLYQSEARFTPSKKLDKKDVWKQTILKNADLCFYFRHLDSNFNCKSLGQLIKFCLSFHGENSCDLKLKIGDADFVISTSDQGLHPYDSLALAGQIGYNRLLAISVTWVPTREGCATPRTLCISQVLKYNGIASPYAPYNEIVNATLVHSQFPSTAISTTDVLVNAAQCTTEGYPKGTEVYALANERLFLEKFFDLCEEDDSLFSIGYNTFGFDIRYICIRCQILFDKNKVESLYNRIGCKIPNVSEKTTAIGTFDYWTLQSANRFEVDLIAWFTQPTRHPGSDNLKLDTVSRYLLGGESKNDISFVEINYRWFKPDDEHKTDFHQRVALYCLQDSHLCTKIALSDKVNALTFNLTASKTMNTLLRLMPINNGGQLEMQNAYIHGSCHERDIVIDPPSAHDVDMCQHRADGAHVFEPRPDDLTGYDHGALGTTGGEVWTARKYHHARLSQPVPQHHVRFQSVLLDQGAKSVCLRWISVSSR